MCEQWKFVYNNTFYMIDDQALTQYYGDSFSHFPCHRGASWSPWRVGRSPQEIYETAKKLLHTCDGISPVEGKIKAGQKHLRREVEICLEDTSWLCGQASVRALEELAHFAIAEDFLRDIVDQYNIQQRNTAVVAIIIKAYRLLEHKHDTSRTCTATSSPEERIPAPKIDQFRQCVVEALYLKEGKVFLNTVEGTWEDRSEQHREELHSRP